MTADVFNSCGTPACLVGNALARAGVEVVAFFACTNNALAANASDSLSTLDGGAVLAFVDALATTA